MSSALKNFVLRQRWILAILALALILRLWALGSLPPGLTGGEARIGLSALDLLHHGTPWSHGVGAVNALYSWLLTPFMLLGHSLWSIRLVAALAGGAAVAGVYLWVGRELGRQGGLIAAFVLAGLAWAVALGRTAGGASLVPAVMALWLWLIRWPAARGRWLAALVAGIGFYASPALWPFWAGSLIYLVVTQRQRLLAPKQLLPLTLWLALVAPGVVWAAVHGGRSLAGIGMSGFGSRIGNFAANLVMAGGDWQQTAGAQPLLNAFYAIMLVLGLIVCVLRWRRHYPVLLILMSGLVAGGLGRDGSFFSAALVPLVVITVIGISTMLEWWYATFPINAAARTSGRIAIGLILALAAYLGYVQYFIAFASSTATYQTYREDAWREAKEAANRPAALVVTDTDAQAIIAYRNYPRPVSAVTARQIKDQKLKSSYYIISPNDRSNMEAILAKLAPGGKLVAHDSPFDGRELYYTYGAP